MQPFYSRDKNKSFYYFDPKIENKLLNKEEFMVAKLKISKYFYINIDF